MKTIGILILACGLTGCGSLTPEQEARASALVDLALRYAEASGRIDAEDAALVREAKVIVLDGDDGTAGMPSLLDGTGSK
jgi:DUF1009 family protein